MDRAHFAMAVYISAIEAAACRGNSKAEADDGG
jgi:hypothetical protein